MSKTGRRGPPKSRKRDKGCDFLSGDCINHVPLGIARPGRVAADVPIVIYHADPGGKPHRPYVERLEQALGLNARTIQIYVDGTRHEALTQNIHTNLERLPDLNDRTYSDAVAHMTNFRSVNMHRASLAETVQRIVREQRHIPALNYAFAVRETLVVAKKDAELRHQEEARFAHDNVNKGQKPSTAVLIRTVLPTLLKDKSDRSVSKIKKDLANRDALHESSDVSYGDLVAIAYHAALNSEWIDPDRVFFNDLFDLAAFAGREALGFREMMDKDQLTTYRTMLCGGEDLHPVVDARTARALVAAIVRNYWRASPSLVRWSRYHGRLLDA